MPIAIMEVSAGLRRCFLCLLKLNNLIEMLIILINKKIRDTPDKKVSEIPFLERNNNNVKGGRICFSQ